VLPTPAKWFLPDFLKNSAAGEKILQHTLCSRVANPNSEKIPKKF
jgi:hypothetical protein